MDIITIDAETFWNSKDYTLSKMGPIAYIRDPRFKVQLLGVRVNQNPVQVFDNPTDINNVLQTLELHRKDRLVVGHNLNGFDAMILSEHYGIRPAWMVDTMALARWCGISRVTAESHAALTQYLGTGVKTAGTVISDGKKWPNDFSLPEQIAFKEYCAADVLQCSENFYKMINLCTPDAVKFMTLTAKMATEPRLLLDRDLLIQYIMELDKATQDAADDLMKIFKFENREHFIKSIRSATIFTNMLRKLGVEPPMKLSATRTASKKRDLEAASVTAAPDVARYAQGQLTDPENYQVYAPALSKTDLEFTAMLDHLDERVRLLVQTRLEQNSSILRTRAEKFLELSQGVKPLPVMLQVFKAHTSRYTAGNDGQSDGTNLQNLNKRNAKDLTLRQAIHAPLGYKIVACDSSQIECRLLAYAAQQTDLLNVFRDGRDPYSEQGEKIFNIPAKDIKAGAKAGEEKMTLCRHISKVLVLSCGYQTGWQKFSDTLLRQGAKLHEDLNKHKELARNAHNIYRLSNPSIVSFWNHCNDVIIGMYHGMGGNFGGPKENLFHYVKADVCLVSQDCPTIFLPSGFTLRYPNLRQQTNDNGRAEYVYDRIRGRNTIATKLYGGALTENLIQSLSFQLLMWQAVRMYEEGIPLICNIHDSWIAVVPEEMAQHTKDRMEYWMSQVPDWLPGLPIACEGKVADDFTIA